MTCWARAWCRSSSDLIDLWIASSTDDASIIRSRCSSARSRSRCFDIVSTKSSGDVVFRFFLYGPRVEPIGGADFDELALEEKRGQVRHAGGLLHVVRDDHDGVMV